MIDPTTSKAEASIMATIVDEAEQVNIKPKTRPRGTNAVKFLQQLRPKGPWVLTAIEPDGPTLTRTFTSKQSEDARQFIVERNDAGDNLYYSLNPTREAMTKKAAKQDIAAVEYLHVDIDPHDDESPDQCKQRALRQVEQFRNEPSFIIDSGNGLQLLWELTHPVELRDFADIGDLEAIQEFPSAPGHAQDWLYKSSLDEPGIARFQPYQADPITA